MAGDSDSSDGYETNSDVSEESSILEPPSDINSMTVTGLREEMKKLGQKNYSRLNKSQLIAKLSEILNKTEPSEETSEDKSESSEQMNTPTLGKRKLPNWHKKTNTPSSKKAKLSDPIKPKPKKKKDSPKPKVSVSREKSLDLAVSSEEESEDISIGIHKDITPEKKAFKIPKLQKSPSPHLSNTWISRKKAGIAASTPLLDENPSKISTSSGSDLLDSLRETSPSKSFSKGEDSLLFGLDSSSGDELPMSPLKKTTHSFISSANLSTNPLDSSDSDNSPDRGCSTQILEDSPSGAATQVLDESPDDAGGTQVLDDSVILDDTASPITTQIIDEENSTSEITGTLVIPESSDEDEYTSTTTTTDKQETAPISTLKMDSDDSMDENETTFALPSQGDNTQHFFGSQDSSGKATLQLDPTLVVEGTLKVSDDSDNELTFGNSSGEFIGFGKSDADDSVLLSPTLPTDEYKVVEPTISANERRKQFQAKMKQKRSSKETADSPILENEGQVTPEIETRRRRSRASAIPFSSNEPDEACTPTIHMRFTPQFYCNPSNTLEEKAEGSFGRLVPIYSTRDIIHIQKKTIIFGSDTSCTISYLFDSRIEKRHCEISLQHKRVLVRDLR